MLRYSITLKTTYSCPALATLEGLKLPENWSLCWHQLEVLRSVRNPEIDVIYYYGITGSGKSLAAYLDTLQGGVCALGVYPTEELVQQQKKQIQKYLAKFQPDARVRVNSLTKKDLELYTETQDISLLEFTINHSEILLIDPDILNAWYQSQFSLSKVSLTPLWHQLEERFKLFIIDEFYQFNPCQITSIINLMFLLYYRNSPQKFLYISTTPNPKMIERSKVLGWNVKVINTVEDNQYKFLQTQTESQQLKAQKWRQVSPEINLNFVSVQSKSSASETWLRDNQDLIIAQFVQNSATKGAIILNSVATVKRLLPFFQGLFKPLGLKVAENTDLSAQSSADLVLGTTTMGLAEDNPINFLIFESANVGQFIHRLGKIRTKNNDEDNRHGTRFESLNAYALVPNFFVEHLFEGDSPTLKSNNSYEPASFPTLIRSVYRQVGDWHGYYTRWGAIQSMKVYQQLGFSNIKEKYPNLQQEFQTACEEMFKFYLRETLSYYQEWQQISETEDGDLHLKNLVSCSSKVSPLFCGIYDSQENNEVSFQVYDLPEILINMEVQPISEIEFRKLLKEGEIYPNTKFKQCLAWMKLKTYRQEEWNWRFTSPEDLEPIAASKTVQILLGIQIWQLQNNWINQLNIKLKQRTLAGYILDCPVTEVRQKFRLPMHFPIYPISQQTDYRDTIAPYSVAFGESALLLDTWAS